MHRWFLVTASLIGALSVALGAFAAHGLKQVVSPEAVATFETGVRYQFYHAFALLIVAIIYEKYPGKLLQWAGNCFQVGIILFSGSLYVLTALKATDTVGLSKIGLITPFGGLFFIAGWILMVIACIKKGPVHE
ncbi:MAG TPA: DUF423 domain-containing protein [Chitinophagaceae bacterium]|nr:DUF423 domain-containing protein [Chitinophagaceae bacterium]